MTCHPSIADLRLDAHWRMLRACEPDALALALCDADGRVLRVVGEAESALRAALEAPARLEPTDAGAGASVWRAPDGSRVLCVPLTVDAPSTANSLYAMLGAGAGGQRARGAVEILANVGAAVARELGLLRELTDMAEELGARYEELNLIYGLDDHVERYDPEQGQDALLRLVEDCARYLDLHAVALLAPEYGIDLQYTDPSLLPHLRSSESWPAVNAALLERVRQRRQPAVVNDPQTPADGLAPLPAPVKAVAVPVTGVDRRLCGVLAIVGDLSRPDFSNGDRKLLEVLADHASAVIRANLDGTTGLLSRKGFASRARKALQRLRADTAHHVLLYVDLDNFKLINDACGYSAGDELLCQIAALVRSSLPGVDAIARLGSDEFAVLLEHCSVDQARVTAARVSDAIRAHRFSWHGKIFDLSASLGVAAVTGAEDDVAGLLNAADAACHLAKQQGRGRVLVFDQTDDEYAEHIGQVLWMPRITRALSDGGFELFAQPIRPLGDDGEEIPHFEILLRLRGDDSELIGPSAFVPVAERYHAMPELDRWVVGEAVSALAAAGAAGESLRASVNLSGQSFSEEGFLDFVVDAVTRSGIGFGRLCFEVTETAAISNFGAALNFISALKHRGAHFALDDFGAGLSSFSYLKSLPVDYLKIDGSFVREIARDSVAHAMVESANQIGHVMGLRTIAEFVEDHAVLHALKRLGVDYAQGYAVARPRPLGQLLGELRPASSWCAAGG